MRSACQIPCELMNLIQIDSGSKKTNFLLFSHSVPLHLIIKYAIMLHFDILHLEYFDETMTVLQNFERTILG